MKQASENIDTHHNHLMNGNGTWRLGNPLKVVLLPALLVAVISLIFGMEVAGVIEWRPYGLRPGKPQGLLGLLSSPFLHGSGEHLFNNSIPLFVLTWTLLYFYKELFWKVILWVMLLGGFLVWLSGEEGSNHIGASGVIYGLVGFLFFSGILRRHPPLIAISMLMIFLYGSLIWGVFPVQEHVSWEGHLWGGVVGSVMAFYYKPEGPQRRRYAWEFEEEEEDMDEEDAYWKTSTDSPILPTARPVRIRYHIKPSPAKTKAEESNAAKSPPPMRDGDTSDDRPQ